MKHKYRISVRCRIIALMLLCWLIPLVLITGANVNYLSGERLNDMIFKEMERLRFSDESSMRRLDRAVELSREASYEGTLEGLYEDYQAGTVGQVELVRKTTDYLQKSYGRDDRILSAVLWYWEDPNHLYSNIYNSGLGSTYAQINRYWQLDHRDIAQRAGELGTRAEFYVSGGQLYLVRNLCTGDFKEMATLVFLINQAYCFQSYSNFPAETSVTLYLDHEPLQLAGTEVTADETGIERVKGRTGYSWSHDVLKLFDRESMGGHSLISLVRYEDNSAFLPFAGLRTILVGMVFCLIPLLLTLLSLFSHYITKPIRKMVEGAEKIENGHLGYQLDYEADSKEFQYLTSSFNSMSSRLEYQFHHIYEEELALRDARIKALQSHINPHFMNNTLEIINWEARMAGNDKVSEMIEALATLMNAGIDRKSLPIIPLSEEMIYVNAYFYIISQRLGSRVTIINEFPEEIMKCMVPRLILQPVIENAIEHGVVRNGKGTVLLYGYEEGDFLYLEIMNDSVLREEDKKNIDRLLNTRIDPAHETAEHLGIANVNQRLKILYGEESGLTVEQVDPRHVCSRLKILQKKPENDGNNKKMQDLK